MRWHQPHTHNEAYTQRFTTIQRRNFRKTFVLYDVSKQFTIHTKTFEQKCTFEVSRFTLDRCCCCCRSLSQTSSSSLCLSLNMCVCFLAVFMHGKSHSRQSAYRPIALLHLMLFHMFCYSTLSQALQASCSNSSTSITTIYAVLCYDRSTRSFSHPFSQ